MRGEKSCVSLPNFMNMIMSSTTKKPVLFPDSVDVLIQNNECIEVKGQKGELDTEERTAKRQRIVSLLRSFCY